MAQRKRDKRPASTEQSEWVRLDGDGHECPGPHADVIFVLEPAGVVRRRLRFWMKLIGRAPSGHGQKRTRAGAAESG